MTTPADVVNAYQCNWRTHPLTCGTCTPPKRDRWPMIATMDGEEVVLHCPLCGELQVMRPELLALVEQMSVGQ